MRTALPLVLAALTLAACDSGDAPPSTTEVPFTVVTPEPYTLAAEHDSLTIDLVPLLRNRKNLPVTFTLAEAPTGVRIHNQHLHVSPQPLGPMTVRVRGTAGEDAAEVVIRGTFVADQVLPLTSNAPTLRSGVDTFKVDVSTLLKSKYGLPVTYSLVSAPSGTQIVNGRLLVSPQPVGQASVTIRGATRTASGETTIYAAFVPNSIAVLRSLPDYSLRARGDSVVVNLETVFRSPLTSTSLVYSVVTGATEAFVRGSSLVVRPQSAGTFDVRVRASLAGTPDAETSLRLSATGDWCAAPPSGSVEPLPFQPGDAVQFRLRSVGWYTVGQSSRTSTVTWRFQKRECEFGRILLTFTEHEAGADTTYAGVVTSINETRTHTVALPSSGYLPTIGSYVRGVSRGLDRFFYADSDGVGLSSDGSPGICSGGRCGPGIGVNATATAAGLASVRGSHAETSFSFTRLP